MINHPRKLGKTLTLLISATVLPLFWKWTQASIVKKNINKICLGWNVHESYNIYSTDGSL